MLERNLKSQNTLPTDSGNIVSQTIHVTTNI
jgi:hypothetical protein